MAISVLGIFETHLSVGDRHKAAEFYQRVAGLEFAGEFPERDITFLWVGGSKRNMLGLWGPGATDAPISRGRFHFAFEVSLEQFETAAVRLKEMGVQPLDFDGEPTDEPDVLAWVPNLSLYFKDLDGHSIEFLAVLDEKARPELGILKWSEWKKRI